MTSRNKDLLWLRSCALMSMLFSTCTRRQYAAFIVDPSGRVVGFGYNGSPPGQGHCTDGACPRANSSVQHGSQYDEGPGRCIAVHAEANALLFSDATARAGATLYVNGPPCPDCSKLIAASGISRVVHTPDEAYPTSTLPEMGIEVIEVTL